MPTANRVASLASGNRWKPISRMSLNVLLDSPSPFNPQIGHGTAVGYTISGKQTDDFKPIFCAKTDWMIRSMTAQEPGG